MTTLAVLPVGFAGMPTPAAGMVAVAAERFAGWSRGALAPRVQLLPAVDLLGPAARFAALGGLTRLGGPALAAAALRLAEPLRGAALVLVADGPFHPHCWRLDDGRPYALLPAGTSAGMAAHELGHLLLGWKDQPGAGRWCLMGQAVEGPPGAPLRVAAGWDIVVPAAVATTLRHLGHGVAGAGADLMERRGEHLLVWQADAVRSMALRPEDFSRPLLALLAASAGYDHR